MQQDFYNKLNIINFGFVIFCSIVAILVVIFFLAPMMQFGGGPFGMGVPPNIPDNVLEDLKTEIYALESVTTFKETFPEYRETLKEDYGVRYILQARNNVTGNVFALEVGYHPMGPPGSTDKFQKNEHLNCFPGEGIFGGGEMGFNPMMFRGGEDLFVHETIKSTNCLDNDWLPVMISDK